MGTESMCVGYVDAATDRIKSAKNPDEVQQYSSESAQVVQESLDDANSTLDDINNEIADLTSALEDLAAQTITMATAEVTTALGAFVSDLSTTIAYIKAQTASYVPKFVSDAKALATQITYFTHRLEALQNKVMSLEGDISCLTGQLGRIESTTLEKLADLESEVTEEVADGWLPDWVPTP